MNSNAIDQARVLLTREGFSTELSSIMVDDSVYIGHRISCESRINTQVFKIEAEVDSLEQVVESCENIVLLAKSLHRGYNCEINLRKYHSADYKPAVEAIKNPVQDWKSTGSVYDSYVELMKRGWGYSDAIIIPEGGKGELSRRLTISRWNWHDHDIVNPVLFYQEVGSFSQTNEAFQILKDRAFQAWEEFKDSIPLQDTNGKLRPNFQANHLVHNRESRLL